jgi:hypothetical protein
MYYVWPKRGSSPNSAEALLTAAIFIIPTLTVSDFLSADFVLDIGLFVCFMHLSLA